MCPKGLEQYLRGKKRSANVSLSVHFSGSWPRPGGTERATQDAAPRPELETQVSGPPQFYQPEAPLVGPGLVPLSPIPPK